MSSKTSIKTNLIQNREDFNIGPLDEQPPLFKFKYLEKILNAPQEDPEDIRTCTVKCIIKGCQ
jgi:hypothetical protein